MSDKILILFDLFDKYFLILMLIEGFTLSIYDYNKFENDKEHICALRARKLGYSSIFISIALYFSKLIIR
ncbi:CLC_0170 family protein [Haloimpatiens sp. FM7315]|uniref:CLC_0170 family protein n=1 Tax=Haloimpatiens sp. FM7315 TaxID=3298609 RepID=UPI0035A2CB73